VHSPRTSIIQTTAQSPGPAVAVGAVPSTPSTPGTTAAAAAAAASTAASSTPSTTGIPGGAALMRSGSKRSSVKFDTPDSNSDPADRRARTLSGPLDAEQRRILMLEQQLKDREVGVHQCICTVHKYECVMYVVMF